jgi:hypothetical protein
MNLIRFEVYYFLPLLRIGKIIYFLIKLFIIAFLLISLKFRYAILDFFDIFRIIITIAIIVVFIENYLLVNISMNENCGVNGDSKNELFRNFFYLFYLLVLLYWLYFLSRNYRICTYLFFINIYFILFLNI